MIRLSQAKAIRDSIPGLMVSGFEKEPLYSTPEEDEIWQKKQADKGIISSSRTWANYVKEKWDSLENWEEDKGEKYMWTRGIFEKALKKYEENKEKYEGQGKKESAEEKYEKYLKWKAERGKYDADPKWKDYVEKKWGQGNNSIISNIQFPNIEANTRGYLPANARAITVIIQTK